MSTPVRASDPISRTALALREQISPPPRASSNKSVRGKIPRRYEGIKGDALSAHFAQEDVLEEDIPLSDHKNRHLPSTLLPTSTHGNNLATASPRTPASYLLTPNTYEIELCEEFDKDFELIFFEREVEYRARLLSVRRITGITFALFASYLVIGCLYFSVWSEESKWPLEESLIFLIYTVTTVGYGNHVIPTSRGSRIFIIFYILIGIALVTVVFSEVYQYLILEAARAQYVHSEHKIREKGIEASMRNELKDEENQNQVTSHALAGGSRKIFLCTVLFEIHSRVKCCMKNTKFGQFAMFMLPLVSLLIIGATVVGSLEGWDAIDSVYWAVVTLTTVGYGDLAPSKPSSIWFCIFYLPTATIFLSLYLSNIAKIYLELHLLHISRIEKKLRKMRPSLKEQGLVKSDHSYTDGSSPATQPSGSEGDKITLQSGDGKAKSKSMRDVMNTARKIERRQIPQDYVHIPILQTTSEDVLVPSLSLRTKIQKRLAFIICKDFCNAQSIIEVKGDRIITTFSSWKAAAEKWNIPKKAKGAFRSLSFELFLLIGMHDISIRGIDAILDLKPDDFQRLFNPVLAVMGSAECMESWLLSTEPLMNK